MPTIASQLEDILQSDHSVYEQMCKHMCKYAVVPSRPSQEFLEHVAKKPMYAAVFKILDHIRRTGKYDHLQDDTINFSRCPSAVATYLIAYGRKPAFSFAHTELDQFLELEHIALTK